MSLPPPSGYAIASLEFTQTTSGRKAVVTFGVKPPGASSASAVNSAVSTYGLSTGKVMHASRRDISWSTTKGYCLYNNAGVLTSDTVFYSIPGTQTWNSPPPNVAIVVNRRTALAGRQYRGHIQVPAGFIDESEIGEDGVIAGGTVTSMQTEWTAFRTDMATAGYPLYLLHGTPISGVVPIPTAITSLAVSSLAGTQRRRLRR